MRLGCCKWRQSISDCQGLAIVAQEQSAIPGGGDLHIPQLKEKMLHLRLNSISRNWKKE